MLRSLKIPSPRATKTRLTANPVRIESLIILFLFSFETFSVIDIKIGRTTNISTATKIGMNVFRIFLRNSSIIPVPFQDPPMPFCSKGCSLTPSQKSFLPYAENQAEAAYNQTLLNIHCLRDHVSAPSQ